MEVREAKTLDIPAIVELLKLSLGESLMPKSEKYWRWKHLENPFGLSAVLLCWEGDVLIGVRAFMRWEWRLAGKTYHAVRAVDTATHPDYQGKGIFKKLTLSLLENCKQNNIHFVFNTPNKSSKPGYIKMGWQEAGKLPLRVYVARPFTIAINLLLQTSRFLNLKEHTVEHFLNHSGLDNLIACQESSGVMVTNYSSKYLQWRYQNISVAHYEACGIEDGLNLNALMFYRIKSGRAGNELRITDIFVRSKNDSKRLVTLLRKRMELHNVHYVTLSGCDLYKSLLFNYFFVPILGPFVTIKNINLEGFSDMKNFKKWQPSLGDMELF